MVILTDRNEKGQFVEGRELHPNWFKVCVKPLQERKCPICYKSFSVKPYVKKMFCSMGCRTEWRTRNNIFPPVETRFVKGKENPWIKGNKFAQGHSPLNKGKRWNEWMSKEGQKKARTNLQVFGKGENNLNWKDGITPERVKIRQSIEYKLWEDAVIARDNWDCQKCEKQLCNSKLVGHHIQNFSQYPELRFAIDNGITFCRECHKDFHRIYGKKNNTKEQIEKFLKIIVENDEDKIMLEI